MMSDNLPELPDCNFVDIDGQWYNEAKLREYARLAVDEALERAASVCDAEHIGGQRDDDLGWTSCAAVLAAAIRQLKGKQ